MRVLLLAGAMAVLALLVVLAMAALIREAARGWPRRGVVEREGLDPYPAAAVEGGPGVSAVAAATLVWAVLNALLAGAWIVSAATSGPAGEDTPRTLTAGAGSLLAACGLGGALLVAACLSLAGALELWRGKARGRRLISWGQFLMGMLAFIVGGTMLLIWASGGYPKGLVWLAAAPWWATAMAVHLLIDAALGAAAQQVGRPGRPRKFEFKPIA